jgi:hypothetical protein
MNLGKRQSGEIAPVNPDTKGATSYPSLSFSDSIAKAFLKKYKPEVGDELTATVKLRVSGINVSSYGHSVSFDVEAINNVKDSGGASEPDLAGEMREALESDDDDENDENEPEEY